MDIAEDVKGRTQGELVAIISAERGMTVRGEFDGLRAYILGFITDEAALLVDIICALRGAFPARRMIPGWIEMVDLAAETIRRRWPYRNPESLLQGLWSMPAASAIRSGER